VALGRQSWERWRDRLFAESFVVALIGGLAGAALAY
jgi:hypothetical protein